MNRVNAENKHREVDSEVEPDIDNNENYFGITITILTVGFLSGFFLYMWFMTTPSIHSLNLIPFIFASLVFITVLSLIIFGVSSFLLKRRFLSSKRLVEILYFGSVIGVIIGVVTASLSAFAN